jgi:23S rRNA (uracil1939-C5)-methyltransferase
VDEIVLHIDSLAAGGDGVARAPDGRVVFVPYTAPGDRVRVRIEKRRSRFARARVVELLEPGPSRVEPRCAAFGCCGGCAWQHLDYPAQVEAKRRILADALTRIGGVALDEAPPFTASPRPYGYRLRARLLVEGGRVGYRRRASHALCAVGACPVLLPELEARLAELAARPPARGGEWELGCAGGEVRVTALGRKSARSEPQASGGRTSKSARSEPQASGGRTSKSARSEPQASGGRAGLPAREEPLQLEVAGERLCFSPGVFAQANALLLEPLLRAVLQAVGGGEQLVELFAGSGLFTLPLARRFLRVVAVEADPAAARDLRANLAAAGLSGVRVLRRRVEEAGRELAGLSPEAVLLDPPRAGLAAGGIALLARLAPRRVVYLSCDPATLARDVAALRPHGYQLLRVEGFDLFPQTPHVEALAVLSPPGVPAAAGTG